MILYKYDVSTAKVIIVAILSSVCHSVFSTVVGGLSKMTLRKL